MSIHDIPWPPPSAASIRHLHDLGRSPVLRHTADLYWTAHLPEVEREQVLDHMTLHDLRNSAGAEIARLRARQDTDRQLCADLAAFHRQASILPPHIDTPTVHTPRIRPPSTWDEAA